jgi:enamine deaminase RidA (YjgF/YER057c/UK114 family)
VRLQRLRGLDVLQPAASPTVLRRFAGPKAVELVVLCRPEPQSADVAQQARSAYRDLVDLLSAHGASTRDLASETLFLRHVERDLPRVLEAREKALADSGQAAGAPLPAFIGQAPLVEGASLELAAWAVVPHDRDAWSVRDVRAVPSCACEGCARTGARLVGLDEQLSVHTTNVYGAGDDAYAQTWEMFCAAERLLQQAGVGFHDVARAWIHLRDIDRDYDALNRARREFFRDRDIALLPASTGVQGVPFPDAHDVSLRLEAVRSPRPPGFTAVSTPTLNEAWSYGADFSRGLRLSEANKATLHVSGTASIDEAGRTVHIGDFEAQVGRMLDNIEALLAGQGAGFGNLVSAITYLKNPGDAQVLRSMYRRRGLIGFPCAIVEAGLCRPELLCETEAVAILPLQAAGA